MTPRRKKRKRRRKIKQQTCVRPLLHNRLPKQTDPYSALDVLCIRPKLNHTLGLFGAKKMQPSDV